MATIRVFSTRTSNNPAALIVHSVLFLFVLLAASGCGGPTKVHYQQLDPQKPQAVTIDGITVRVVSFGTTEDWSELELAVANETGEPLLFNASEAYLTNEKNYDLPPLKSPEINARLRRKTGNWITPLTLAAAAAGIGAIVVHDRGVSEALGNAAFGLAGAAAVDEVSKNQSADKDRDIKEDMLLKTYEIPPGLQVGGTLYYRRVESARAVKVFIDVRGQKRVFHIDL